MQNNYNNIIIAKRYAKALFTYANELGVSYLVYNDMNKLTRYISESTHFNSFINNKLILMNIKLEVMLKLIQFTSMISLNFIKLIFLKKRILILKLIIIEYKKIYNAINHIYNIKIITAIDIDLILQKKIINRLLSNKFQYQIDYKINKEIIGGFCIYIESKKLDFTIKNLIFHIKNNFIN